MSEESTVQHILDRRALCGHLTTVIHGTQRVPSGGAVCPTCLDRYEAILAAGEPEYEYAIQHRHTGWASGSPFSTLEQAQQELACFNYPEDHKVIRRVKTEWEDVQ